MRVIEVHVPYLHSFSLWLEKLHQQLGGLFSPWDLMLSTSPTDDIWFRVYSMGYTVATLHLDWDESKKKCKISIHSSSDITE